MQSEKRKEKQETKKTKKNKQKKKKKQLARHKNQFHLQKIRVTHTRGYLKGTCQNGTSNMRENLRKKGSTQHAKKQLKRGRQTAKNMQTKTYK